ncbi:MAG TPA: sigma-70 family RNA polymerase sigma factor [Anaerolineae bacterium]|nr:sigma-70 family RNA polymerase sigma factor [Anaerolineae bacterium]
MDYSGLDDSALVALVARRDANALSELYDRYSRLVYSLALRVVGERNLAEEVVLDSFYSVWRAAGSFVEERGRFVGWLMSVARHRAIDELRRLKVRPEGTAVELDDSLKTPQPDGPEDVVEMLYQREIVREVLSHLPEPQRKALELAYFGGLTQQEIAVKTSTPLGTVKTRIRLGLLKMRDELRRAQDDQNI